MIKIRRACACLRVSSLRHTRLKLYALLVAVVIFFLLVTVVLNNIHYWIQSEEMVTTPTINMHHILRETTPSTTKVDKFNVHKELTTTRFLPKRTTVEHVQPKTHMSYQRKPHMVWDTSLRHTDRIMEQLMYIPQHINTSKVMNILVWQKGGGEYIIPGNSQFINDSCLVTNCYIMVDIDPVKHVDALITSVSADVLKDLLKVRTNEDVWIYYELESPELLLNTEDVLHGFNWTATYRHDSTIVAPYEKWLPFQNATQLGYFQQTDLLNNGKIGIDKNYASGKSKMAAALISNCGAGTRLEVIRALSKYIQVDVYGACGTACNDDCFEILRNDYKFYLAFENSNCVDYITEKLFKNAFGNNILPVVFGAPPPDYLRAAPPYSYIHVDNFPSVLHLATYLKVLDKNDTLYNSYFKWMGTGTFINTKFWCRLCAMLNDLDKPYLEIPDINKWLTDRTCRSNYGLQKLTENTFKKTEAVPIRSPVNS